MNLLVKTLLAPGIMAQFTEVDWEQLIRFARHARMIATLRELVFAQGIENSLPELVAEVFEAERVRCAHLQLQARRELRELESAFQGAEYPLLLLKGTAYLAAELPPAAGRRFSDVDLLVAKEHLEDAEERLLDGDWQFEKGLTEYDENYYRNWAHEIPPLRHPVRMLEVDLHHNLTPHTSRIKLDPSSMIQNSVSVPGSKFRMLAPMDMFLHSATHLFFNDELRGGFRDLADMHQLAMHFAADDMFWRELPHRAHELGLHRPLFYALSTCQRIMHTNVPQTCQQAYEKFSPPLPVRALMARLIDNTLASASVNNLSSPISQWLLYVRAKWVSMPPFMLSCHLLYKSLRT